MLLSLMRSTGFTTVIKTSIKQVRHAELASVRAILVKGLDHTNLPSSIGWPAARPESKTDSALIIS
jgi:hypothetical protein